MPKLRMYKTIKSEYGVEDYVKHGMTLNKRSVVAKVRSGTLPIHVETGRYRGTDYEDRRCSYCPDDIENETHFLFKCPLYKDFRAELLPDNCHNPKSEQFEACFNGIEQCRKTATFIIKALDIRQTYV